MSENPVNDRMPMVSVVLPCYNHVGYVERAIKSVLDQTYPSIQLIVIDDGSKDGSVDLLKSLSEKYGFDLICQENRGVCRTLNRAIKECAKGDYIALLASDDFWHTEKVERQIVALKAGSRSEFCFTQAIEFQDESHPDHGRIFPRKLLQGNVLNSVFIRQHVPAGTMLFSRRLYDELAGFDENLKEEDWDFVIRSAAKTEFVGVDMPLFYYRSHVTNTMKTRDRAATFHQKALILSKNFRLVNPWRWLLAIVIHFVHDIVVQPISARVRG